jgi:integrase
MERPLYIPKGKRGHKMVVYCRLCKTNCYDSCHQTGEPLLRCPNGESHVFKAYVHVPGTKKGRKTKNLGRDLNEAIKQAIEFEKEVKSNIQPGINISENKKENNKEDKNTPHLLIHALARYSGWLHGEEVPSHLQEERSADFIKDIERKLKLLVVALQKKGYDISTFRVDDLNDEVVGNIRDYWKEEHGFSPRTFNKHLDYSSAFLRWFSEEYYPVRAWFKRGNREPVTSNPQSITQQEFGALLKVISSENGIAKYSKGVKEERNFYRPYLKNAFRLALETGTRRDELINMKFSNIAMNEDGSGYIKSENYKVNNIEKRKTEKEKKYVIIPMTYSLRQLLYEIGYEEMKGTDKYIIAPEIKDKRNKVMADLLSRSFSHFYQQLNTGRQLTFRSIRKAYISAMSVEMGDNARAFWGHTTEETTNRYYKDRTELAKSARNIKMFSPEGDRNNQLDQIRNRSINTHKNKEVEK